MIINGIEFDFSTLNANDVDRMLAAQTRQQERARTEGSRYTPENDYSAWLRFQCRIFMDYLDEVLGEGASEKMNNEIAAEPAMTKPMVSMPEKALIKVAKPLGSFPGRITSKSKPWVTERKVMTVIFVMTAINT